MPVLSGPADQPIMYIEFTDTRGITHKANKCLQEFQKICVENVQNIEINLSSGDLLLFDNRINIHSRNAYNEDVSSAFKRWLQRIFIKDGGLLEWKDQIIGIESKTLKF